MSLRKILEERKTLILKEPLIKMFWSERSLVVSKADLAKISRDLQYFSDDLTRLVREAERRGVKVVWHRVIGRMGLDDAMKMAFEARESSEKVGKLVDRMVEAGVEKITLE